MDVADAWVILMLILIPLYLSNGLPVLLGGGMRLDGNYSFPGGGEWLGPGKTIRGTLVALVSGWTGVYLLYVFFPLVAADFPVFYLQYGMVMVVGAVLGDVVASFFKRRAGKMPGEPVLLLDQLDFIAGGLIAGALFFIPGVEIILAMIFITLVLHKVTNYIAYRMRWKKVPW